MGKEKVEYEPNCWEQFLFNWPRIACCVFLSCAVLLSSLCAVFPFEIQLQLVFDVRSNPINQAWDAWRMRKRAKEGNIFVDTDIVAEIDGIISAFVSDSELKVRTAVTIQGRVRRNFELVSIDGGGVETRAAVRAALEGVPRTGDTYSRNISLGLISIGEPDRPREGEYQAFGLYYESTGEEPVTSPTHLKAIAELEDKVLAMSSYVDRCRLIYSSVDNSTRCQAPLSVLQHIKEAPSKHQELFGLGFGSAVPPGLCGSTNGAQIPYGEIPCRSQAFLHLEGKFPSHTDIAQKLVAFCAPVVPAAPANPSQLQLLIQDMYKLRAQYLRAERNFLVDKSFDCSTGDARFLRTRFPLGWPIPDSGPAYHCGGCEDDAKTWLSTTFAESIREWIADLEESSGSSLRVYVDWGPYWGDLMNGMLWRDGLRGIGSIIAVWVFLWVNLQSLFLASLGILEVVLSIPMSVAIWSMATPIRHDDKLSGLQVMVIFIILGVGADDIFVLVDAYKQAYRLLDPGTAPVQRFAWAYRRASGAMLVTSAATMLGMAAATVSSLPCIATFGIFGMLAVFFDFVMVISYFAAVLVIYERHVMHRCNYCTFVYGLPGRLMTRWRDTSASQTQARRTTGTIAWGADECQEELRRNSLGGENEIGFVEQFFQTKYEDWVLSYARFLVPAWSIFFVAMGICVGVLLRPAQSEPDFFEKSHPIQRFFDVSADEFYSAYPQQVVVAFGMADVPIDRTGVGLQEHIDVGEPVYSGKLADQLAGRAVQQEIMDFCLSARSSPLVDAWSPEQCSEEILTPEPGVWVRVLRNCRTGVYCFMEPIRDYLELQLNQTFPPGKELLDILSSPGWQAYLGSYKEVLRREGIPDYQSGCAWSGKELLYCYLTVNATMPGYSRQTSGYDILKGLYDDYQSFFDSGLKSIPFRQTTSSWNWMVTQGELVQSSLLAVCGCLLLALLILVIFTGNVVISLLTMLNISGVVLIVFGMVALMGWSLGIMESLGMIVIVGLSVDYSCHVMHAYNECNEPDRRARARHAAQTMGVSVVSGAVTTFLASLFLWFASITFFFNFGTFMGLTILFSILCTLTFLIPLAYICGPQGSCGDLPVLSRCHQQRLQAVEAFSNEL